MFDHATQEGFVRRAHREMLIISSDVDEMLNQMEAYQTPVVEKWITREDV